MGAFPFELEIWPRIFVIASQICYAQRDLAADIIYSRPNLGFLRIMVFINRMMFYGVLATLELDQGSQGLKAATT